MSDTNLWGATHFLVLSAAVLATACTANSPQVDSGWVEHEPMTVARSEHPAVLLDGRIVVVGGLVEAGFGEYAATDSVEAYDLESDIWQELPDLPSPRHHVMAAVVSGRLFVVGGLAESGSGPVSTVWELVEGGWVDRAPLPLPVGSGAAVTLNDELYVLGGIPAGGLLRYDVVDDGWVELSPPQQAREHLAAAARDHEILAIAGRWEGQVFDTTEIYDVASDVWRAGPRLGEARSGFGAALADGSIVVAGGEVFDPTTALSSVEVLDPDVHEWRLAEPLPDGLHGNPLVAVDASVYLPGGSYRAAGVDNAGEMLSLVLS